MRTLGYLASWTLALQISGAHAQCPEKPPIQNYSGGGTTTCPCFVPGEEAGAVFTPPAADLPLEVLRVGIGWGSQFGGAPQSLEQGIHVYAAGLPDPGPRIATLPGPVLTDGAINEYDLEPLSGEIIIQSAPFSITLEFLNQNANQQFAPSVVHDGNGCQTGKNLVKAIPGGWADACALGVTGDWVFYAIYRPACGTGVETVAAPASTAELLAALPNPFRRVTRVRFSLDRPAQAELAVYDVSGRLVARLGGRHFPAGERGVDWDGRRDDGAPVAAGTYFVRLDSGRERATARVVRIR